MADTSTLSRSDSTDTRDITIALLRGTADLTSAIVITMVSASLDAEAIRVVDGRQGWSVGLRGSMQYQWVLFWGDETSVALIAGRATFHTGSLRMSGYFGTAHITEVQQSADPLIAGGDMMFTLDDGVFGFGLRFEQALGYYFFHAGIGVVITVGA